MHNGSAMRPADGALAMTAISGSCHFWHLREVEIMNMHTPEFWRELPPEDRMVYKGFAVGTALCLALVLAA
jgi:hypothetical protein